MKKYLAYDACNGEYEEFETIEEARDWLKEGFLTDDGYNLDDMRNSKIYTIAETVEWEVTDRKSNYKYEYEDDIPEDDNESEAWPHDSIFDEVGTHKFVPVGSYCGVLHHSRTNSNIRNSRETVCFCNKKTGTKFRPFSFYHS